MEIPLYQVDAFAEAVFAGNPAAVCPLESWLDDAVMQRIAAENNLSETAFLVPRGDGDGYELRWFTPTNEVDLCGHATLASAFVLRERLGAAAGEIAFHTRSGRLSVAPRDGLLELLLPALPAVPKAPPAALTSGLKSAPSETLQAANGNWMAVYASQADIAALAPDFAALAALHPGGVIATAPADAAGLDFVSRFFAPSHGIPEDPVTGSAHCTLTPYWAERLGRPVLRARQISARGGELLCAARGAQVAVAGRAVLYLEGWISL